MWDYALTLDDIGNVMSCGYGHGNIFSWVTNTFVHDMVIVDDDAVKTCGKRSYIFLTKEFVQSANNCESTRFPFLVNVAIF